MYLVNGCCTADFVSCKVKTFVVLCQRSDQLMNIMAGTFKCNGAHFNACEIPSLLSIIILLFRTFNSANFYLSCQTPVICHIIS